jgi:hypothetical protein
MAHFCPQTDVREQIGHCQLDDSPHGLKVNGQLVLHTERARQMYALMKAKALRGLSIAYDTIKSKMQDGERLLQEVKLYEISVTPFPMKDHRRFASCGCTRTYTVTADGCLLCSRDLLQRSRQQRGDDAPFLTNRAGEPRRTRRLER